MDLAAATEKATPVAVVLLLWGSIFPPDVFVKREQGVDDTGTGAGWCWRSLPRFVRRVRMSLSPLKNNTILGAVIWVRQRSVCVSGHVESSLNGMLARERDVTDHVGVLWCWGLCEMCESCEFGRGEVEAAGWWSKVEG